jgi:hypothetical protein
MRWYSPCSLTNDVQARRHAMADDRDPQAPVETDEIGRAKDEDIDPADDEFEDDEEDTDEDEDVDEGE